MAPQIALVLAAFLCSLVAGFLFGFAVVAMPGISSLGDRDFIRAFQKMDGVIQRSQPLFVVMWLGSVVSLVAAVVLGAWSLAGPEKVLLVLAAVVYLAGVQLPTFVVNIPLNNELQRLDVDGADEAACRRARARFEARWNRWNRIRTMLAALTSILLLALLTRF